MITNVTFHKKHSMRISNKILRGIMQNIQKNVDICIVCKLITEIHHIPMCWKPHLKFIGDHPICKGCISNVLVNQNGITVVTEKLSGCRSAHGISLETLQQFESHVMHLGTKYGTRYLLIQKDNHHSIICCEGTCNLTH